MRRRALLAGLAMAAGDGLIRPLNAPGAAQVPTGVQPGVTPGVIVARYVIVFGTGDGVFVYQSGTTPKLGNPPIAWMGSGLVDPYGNVLPSTTGIAGTGTFSAGDTYTYPGAVITYNGAPSANGMTSSNVASSSGFTDPNGNKALYGVTVYLGNAALNMDPDSLNLTVWTNGSGGQTGTWTNTSSLELTQDDTGSTPSILQPGVLAMGVLSVVPQTDSSLAALYASSNAVMSQVTGSGLAGTLPASQSDNTGYTNANSGTVRMTNNWLIPAGDAVTGTTYEIWLPFNGTFEGASIGFKPNFNATSETTSGGDTTGSSSFSTGEAFAGQIRLTLVVTSTGSGGTCNIYLDGGIGNNGARSTGSSNNNIYFSSQATGLAFNTTADNHIAVNSVWGSSVTSQTVTSAVNTFTRKGP